MVFNGHSIESINELDAETMGEVMVMYNDGMLGNKRSLETIGLLVTGVFNYIRAPSSPAYTLKGVLGKAYSYIYEEEESSSSDSLLTFMSQAQGFNIKKFKG